jgi:type IV secretion system protein VirD4
LIVFRRRMYATYGKKVRYYAEKKLAERTRIPAPEMPQIRLDPAVAANSLRVIEASTAREADAIANTPAPAVVSGAGNGSRVQQRSLPHLNTSAINAAKAAPASQRTGILFDQLLVVRAAEAV